LQIHEQGWVDDGTTNTSLFCAAVVVVSGDCTGAMDAFQKKIACSLLEMPFPFSQLAISKVVYRANVV